MIIYKKETEKNWASDQTWETTETSGDVRDVNYDDDAILFDARGFE